MATALNKVKQELNGKGISFKESETNVVYYRTLVPFLRVEVTQLFENSSCGMTHWNKAWRETRLPKVMGSLGEIDISVFEDGNTMISTLVPCGMFEEDSLFTQAKSITENIISQGTGLMTDICFENFLGIPVLFISLEANPGQESFMISQAGALIELFALELLRIYGSSSPIFTGIIEQEKKLRLEREVKERKEREAREKAEQEQLEKKRAEQAPELYATESYIYCVKCGDRIALNSNAIEFQEYCTKCGTRIVSDLHITESQSSVAQAPEPHVTAPQVSQASKENAHPPVQSIPQAATPTPAPVAEMAHGDNKVQNNNSQTNSAKFRASPWGFSLANGKRYLFLAIIGIILLFTGSVGAVIGIAVFLSPALILFFSLYLTVGKNHYFYTKKSIDEVVTSIDNYFNSKQSLSSRKWIRVSGQGELNYEIEVPDFRLRGATGGLTATVSINFEQTESVIVVEAWTSHWTTYGLGLVPRGTFKTNGAISGLVNYLNQNA
jgi:predicted RNA-binding Zn-ribbon protein involved in translation (DUF1610 family)